MRARSFQSNFAMGILDEEAHGRVDLEVYVAAVADCRNAIPSTLGSVRRRPGFIDAGSTQTPSEGSVLLPFRRSGGDQLQLEFGDHYMRIWEPDGALRLSGGAPYELATPWSAEEVEGLTFDQSNDVVYITHASRLIRPYALQRRGDLDWTLPALENRNGPWLPENADPARKIAASALVGTVTLTATGHTPFTPQMVGERLRLRTPDGQPSCASWTPATDYWAHEVVQSDGKLYRAPASDKKSGTAAPIHDTGTVSDGKMDWAFLSDGAAEVLITAYVSATQVEGIVTGVLPGWTVSSGGTSICPDPATVSFGPSHRWAFGAWSERLGWPGHVSVTDEERIAFSGSAADPGRYHVGRAYGYGPGYVDFTPGQGSGRVVDDDALNRSIKGGADAIRWLLTTTCLMFGTSTREGVIQGDTLDDGLTPAGNRPRALGIIGSEPARPAACHGGAIFIPRGGRGLNFLGIGVDQGVQEADLALFVEDLVAERIAGVVWAGAPDKVAWAWTRSGSLLSVTYQPRQNQFGWARHPLPGGFRVDWASVITDTDGRDVLWLIVTREKDGETQRRVWIQSARWRTGDALSDIVYLDACRRYAGAETGTLTGFDHLAGEAVRVFGNGGAMIFDAVVTDDGEVAVIDDEVLTSACVGLRYETLVESLPLDQGGPGETAGALQRVFEVTVKLADCVEVEAAFGDGPLELEGGKPWVNNPAPTAQVFKAKVGGQTSRDARWRVRTDDSWPLTLRSVRASVNVDD